MSDDDLKAAEQRGYARGYVAGRKRLKVDVERERYERERQAFRRKAFLAALPSAILMQGWKDAKGEPITSRNDRVDFAWNVAAEALKRY